MNITKLIFREKKDLKTIWRTIEKVIHVKTKNNVPTNSLLIGETITQMLNLLQSILIPFFLQTKGFGSKLN